MAKALGIENGDFVVEIGPGGGVLTQELLTYRKTATFEFLAIEKDDELSKKLTVQFPNERIVNSDALITLPALSHPNLKVCGSLPYNVASQIIETLCLIESKPKRCAFLVQYEVAKKITAKEGEMNMHTAFIQAFYKTVLVKKVPRGMFNPVPKVDGGIVVFDRADDATALNTVKYMRFTNRFFSQPRKMIKQTLSQEELIITGCEPTLRPESFSAKQIKEMFFSLEKFRKQN